MEGIVTSKLNMKSNGKGEVQITFFSYTANLIGGPYSGIEH